MLDYAVAPYEGKGTAEQALLRQLLSRIPKVISFLAMLTLKTISFWFFCNWQELMWFLRSMAPGISISVNVARGLAKKTVCLF